MPCRNAGLDLAEPFQVGWYNRAVAAEYRVPDFGDPGRLAVLLGNTRALWPRLVATLRARPSVAKDPNPIERYVTETVHSALERLSQRWEVRFAHEPPPRRIAVQRAAHVSGLAYLSPAHLSIHPEHGPWISLRAVAVIDVAGPSGPPREAVRTCADCARSCEAALARALALGTPEMKTVEENWQAWLAVRDSCPIGRASRFQEDHIRYGYTKDREILRRCTMITSDETRESDS
ncbi:MAG: hypothetical protein HY698_21715 [Deltaproteobacteria bacterium]|nr:hypothetical protein [Deltaproteobacteria bacterium]